MLKQKEKTTTQTSVRIRLDRQLKEESEKIFRELGLTTTEAVRIFLSQVRIRKGLPFPVEIESPLEDDNNDLLLSNKMRQSALDLVYED